MCLDLESVPGYGLCLKDFLCINSALYHLAKILKLSTLIITYQKSVPARNLSASRSNLERHPSSRGDSGTQSTAMPEVQLTVPVLSTIYGVR